MITIKRKINTLFTTSRLFWLRFADSPFYRFLPDIVAIKIRYHNTFLRKINLDDPITFNEKLQWLKLYDRKPDYTNMVDKYEAKKIVARLIGCEHIIPTLGVWNKFEDIDFDALPNQFVLKCTHGSGDVIICRNKNEFDFLTARKKIEKALSTDYYIIAREWPYKNVPRRIIAEPFMQDGSTDGLNDYKFFCFDGIPKCLFVATDRSENCKFDYFDTDFNHLDIINIHENSNKAITKPECFQEMKDIASLLSKGFPFIRIDLYQINGKVYFGEYTFFHAGGFSVFKPESFDKKMGEWIKLPRNGG